MLDLLAENQIGILIGAGRSRRHPRRAQARLDQLAAELDGGCRRHLLPGGRLRLVDVPVEQSRDDLRADVRRLMANLSRSVYNYFNPPSS